jgi:hypothetical protein
MSWCFEWNYTFIDILETIFKNKEQIDLKYGVESVKKQFNLIT